MAEDTTPTPAFAHITVRPFVADDFDRVVALMPPEWAFAQCTPQEAHAQARMDFAGVLSCCNVRLVAEQTPAALDASELPLAGILFARVASLPAPEDATEWEARWEMARQELLAGGPAAQLAARYEEQLGERGNLLKDAAGEEMGPDNELELFVANPTMRGCGAGGALMAAFEHLVSQLPEPGYWLQTDTTCTWQWYERHGYTRVADVALTADYPMPPHGLPTNGSSAGHRVFMYQKGCTDLRP